MAVPAEVCGGWGWVRGRREGSAVVVEETETGAWEKRTKERRRWRYEREESRESANRAKREHRPTDAEIRGAPWPNWKGETYHRPSGCNARTIFCSVSQRWIHFPYADQFDTPSHYILRPSLGPKAYAKRKTGLVIDQRPGLAKRFRENETTPSDARQARTMRTRRPGQASSYSRNPLPNIALYIHAIEET